MSVSVVIPTLNEVENLPRLIASLQQVGGIAEIAIADGGSADGTREWVLSQPGLDQQRLAQSRLDQPRIMLVDSPRGKGPQLNAGAALATGNLLLFLHADCRMNNQSWVALQAAIAQPHTAGGAFHIRFAERSPAALRLVEKGINARTSVTRTGTGDQGIFVRRSIFLQIGGAPDWPLFEDVELVGRIKKVGRFVVIKAPLTISGRRYIEFGVVRTALLIFALRLGFWLGVSPDRLKRWFKDMSQNPRTPR